MKRKREISTEQKQRQAKDPSRGKDLTVEAIRSQWTEQYRKVVELCDYVLKVDESKGLFDKKEFFEKAVNIAKELLE